MSQSNNMDITSLHEISPYIGRFSAKRAQMLLKRYAKPGYTIIDPFCGSSVLPLEAAIYGCNVIASDINPYAIVQSRAKLFPPATIDCALNTINQVKNKDILNKSIKRKTPQWVRAFYHPRTLKEIIAYLDFLLNKKHYFHIACLLGILHHQRPGFLSYPSSHTTPYLRENKFPRQDYPELYGYRAVRKRLIKKINRTMRRSVTIDSKIKRSVIHSNVQNLNIPESCSDLCITSPPYMNNLSYGRDNRLRLWFLGIEDWKYYDICGYHTLSEFTELMDCFFKKLYIFLKNKGLCVLVVGEARRVNILNVFKESGNNNGFNLEDEYNESIPDVKRTRKGYAGTISETVLVFKKRSL